MKVRILTLVVSVILLLAIPLQTLAIKQVTKSKNKSAKARMEYRHVPSRDWGPIRNNCLVGFAFTLVGMPYRWGGESTRGFDCSGFTRYVFRQVYGIALPRTSAGQSGVGRAVQRKGLIPGDLVYFRTSGARVSHVGIFIGE
ncbi:MAG TPA: C40 family peptidase, partial [Desulfobacteria bacterium]|nr:C40 family peptidase [Desulfobacteria bacterium]